MSTRHPRSDLLALLEGRLDQPRRAQVEQHLASCPECQAEVFELMPIADTLNVLPAALRSLSNRPADSWAQVWTRVQGVPLRRMVPQLNLYLSLAAVIFVLAAALPAGLGTQPSPVTAGVIQTPIAAQATPVVGKATAAGLAQVGTALAAQRQVTAARPIPVPTPIPGQKG